MKILGEVGCELCGKARIRKVYPYGVRCCEECLHANTVCEYYLPTQLHNINLPRNEKAFPRRGRWSSAYTARFYWRSQLDAYIQKTYNHSNLAEFRLAEAKRLDVLKENADAEKRHRQSIKGKLQTRLKRAINSEKLSPRLEQLLSRCPELAKGKLGMCFERWGYGIRVQLLTHIVRRYSHRRGYRR